MGEHNESKRLTATQHSPRPQFNYFYGSTTTTAEATSTTTTAIINDEQDSLVGLGFSTDNEGTTDDEYQGELQPGKSSIDQSSQHTFASNPILVFLLMAGGLSILILLIIPRSQKEPFKTQKFNMPFPQIDRADFGDPVEGFIDLSLFHSSLVLGDGDNNTGDGGVAATANNNAPRSRSFTNPFPTGAFWTNLVVRSPNDDPMSYPIVVYPFAYRWSPATLSVSYPSQHRVTGSKKIEDRFVPELTVTTKEMIKRRHIVKYDNLSVTLRFISSPSSKFETVLVQGSPYLTLTFTKQTPILKALSTFSDVLCPGDTNYDIDNKGRRLDGFGVCSIDKTDPKYTILRGVQFLFKTPEGVSWLMFASEPIKLVFNELTRREVSSAAPMSGVIRLAYIPKNDDSIKETFESSTGLRRLIYHSDVYPVGGEVLFDFHKSSSSSSSSSSSFDAASSSATLTFKFETRSMLSGTADTKKELLMLALPHHANTMSKSNILSNTDFDINYLCIKGNMTPVVGSTSWIFEEPLYDMGFDTPIQTLSDNIRDLILDQVNNDLSSVLPNYSENVYGYAKQVARLAQLAHIADQLEIKNELDDGNKNSTVNAENGYVLDKARKQLSKYLEAYLSNDVNDSLLFDTNMGGICSTNGLRDKGEDFGNGRYNDHHFHYGYFLYASAIMAKIDPTFIDRFGASVDALYHDIAHSSNGNSGATVSDNSIFFPMSRHKSWFDGHSFATGMFPFGNGKSQESSSEAVNCYYGAFLWSLIRHDEVASDVTDFSRLLLSTEIRSTKIYWHMLPSKVIDNSTDKNKKGASSFDKHLHVYPSEFEENYMVGNVGMLDVAANTWFGNDPLYVQMINALPITAATRLLFDEDYVKHEYPFLISGRDSVEMAWRGYTVSIHSVIDPNKAWEEARSLISNELDSALSKSQVLYFISQQPGFNNSLDSSSNISGSNSNSNSHSKINYKDKGKSDRKSTVLHSLSRCDSIPSCMKLNLTGECCPTSENVMLGCCSVK